MKTDDILSEDVADFASDLQRMTDDEVFGIMKHLETASEKPTADREEVLSRIALVEEEVDRRYPGQLLAPYVNWKKHRSLP